MLPCTINTTVVQLLQQMSLPDWKLYLVRNNLQGNQRPPGLTIASIVSSCARGEQTERELRPTERPGALLISLLKQCGFTPENGLLEQTGKDHSYLYRFICSPEPEALGRKVCPAALPTRSSAPS